MLHLSASLTRSTMAFRSFRFAACRRGCPRRRSSVRSTSACKIRDSTPITLPPQICELGETFGPARECRPLLTLVYLAGFFSSDVFLDLRHDGSSAEDRFHRKSTHRPPENL